MSPARDVELRLADAVQVGSGGAWRKGRLWQESKRIFLTLQSRSSHTDGPGALVLEIQPARLASRAYRKFDDWAFSYRSEGRELSRAQLAEIDRVIAALSSALGQLGVHPDADTLLPIGAKRSATFPTPYQRAYLESASVLEPRAIERFHEYGHVLVRGALRPDVITAARPVLLSAIERSWPTDLPPVHERENAYAQAFTQITDIGVGDPAVRALTHSPRIARMAAELMGVDSVRLFCEDWLVKEPGARITPWHQDEAVFPFDTRATVTCWIPLQDVGADSGLLRFANKSHRIGLCPVENINDTSEREFAQIIREHGFEIERLPPVFVGDISFHHGCTIHGAATNASDQSRYVLALHFFAGDARLKQPTTPTMARLLENAVPGWSVGEPAISPRWPLVYDGKPSAPARTSGRRAEPIEGVSPAAGGNSKEPPETFAKRISNRGALHLKATNIADDTVIDLWIQNGRIHRQPLEQAEELAAPGGFLTCGLVDAHSHISYPRDRDVAVGSMDWMNARRDEYAATGVLLLRDMGAGDDSICTVVDIPGLPRVQPSGHMILPYDDPPFTRTETKDLVRACVERVQRGARWVKVFADWTSDYRDHIDPGFAGTDEVAYPADVLTQAVAAVHSLGGRVAAHCFTHAGAEVAIAARVDSLEHGWGLDARLLSTMAELGIAWVPLVGIASSLRETALADRRPDRARWVEDAMAELARLLPIAEQLGVKVFAGTDRFPEVTVADEVRQLHDLGLSKTMAVAAGTWALRSWLEESAFEEGAPADLVLYREDPRTNLDALFKPEIILLGGEIVEPSFAHIRPRFQAWRGSR